MPLNMNGPISAAIPAILRHNRVAREGRLRERPQRPAGDRNKAGRAMRIFLRYGVFVCGFLAGIAAPGFAQPAAAPTLVALNALQPGQWDLRSRDDPSESRSMCVSDVRTLLQVRHGSAICARFVIANDPATATVHYTCPGSGHGQTTLRVETPRLVQIASQGIVNGAPFAFTAEGRRTGVCQGTAAHR
jgi:hypothetical protein